MKGKNLYLTALIMLVAGVVFILTANTLASFKIVIWAGVLFIIAGLANTIFFLGARDRQGRARTGAFGTAVGWVASAAAIVLGLCMLLFQQTFVPLVSFMLAVLLLFTAIFQICLLLFGSRPVRISPWFFLIPILLFGAAVFIYMQKPGETRTDRIIMYVTGISFALFGVASVIEGSIIAHANHKARKLAEATGPAAEAPRADNAGEAANEHAAEEVK